MRNTLYKYQITKQKIKDIISRMPSNEPLPNRNQLSKQCGVARVTLERAISELIGEGLLVSMDGRGTYVASSSNISQYKLLSKKKSNERPLDDKTWALLVYSVTKGTAPQVLRGVEDFTCAHSQNLVICNTDNNPQKEIVYLEQILKMGVSGIILVPSTHSAPNWPIFDELKTRGISIVTCSRQAQGRDFPGAFQNFFQSGFLASQHLIDLGCRNIAYFATSRYSTIEDRLQGYLAAIDLHNAQYSSDPVNDQKGLRSLLHGDIEVEALFETFLRDHEKTDGVYVFSDQLAISLYRVMQRLSLTPGRDIRVIANDDSGFSSSLTVPLSTIDFPAYRMGKLAAEQLLAIRNGKSPGDCEHIVLGAVLNARESSLGVVDNI